MSQTSVLLVLGMFDRKKPNKSVLIRVQVIDKSRGRFKVVKTIGSRKDALEIGRLVAEAKRFIKSHIASSC